ncbi:G-protein coupled receptor dmsr-1-like [Saccostrea echinata]|uniref:G-protein coupled receptor dmsr-1-like n=1 Tax=Saccostrea echinata TaxID=191078 RepID=UPI002A827B10|nr:G-protein coupled receptor dmsr-1-like [Saccostrea echinata]
MVNITEEITSANDHSTPQVSGYRLIHGYVSGTLCFIGVVFNIFNVIVWSRKNMRTSTNLLLTTLSVADGVSVFMYLLYVTYYFTATGPSDLIFHSKSGMYLVVICFHEFIAFHTFSNWITISLAIFRYIKVCHPNLGKKLCTKKRARLTICIVFIATNLATIPFYLYYEVHDLMEGNRNLTGFWIRKTTFAVTHVQYQTILAWLYGVIFKVIPSIAVSVLCVLIGKELRRADKQRVNKRMSSGYIRTTVMLMIIVFIYVLTELPIGIVSFISGLKHSESHFFYFLLYSYVGDLLDTLTVINGTVNFIVYVILCKQYRTEFKRTILGRFVKRYTLKKDTGVGLTEVTNDMELSKYSPSVLSSDQISKDKLNSVEMIETEHSKVYDY